MADDCRTAATTQTKCGVTRSKLLNAESEERVPSSDEDEPNDALSPGAALPGRPTPTLIFWGDHAGFGACAKPERTARALPEARLGEDEVMLRR